MQAADAKWEAENHLGLVLVLDLLLFRVRQLIRKLLQIFLAHGLMLSDSNGNVRRLAFLTPSPPCLAFPIPSIPQTLTALKETKKINVAIFVLLL
jgi:hypothetical protein